MRTRPPTAGNPKWLFASVAGLLGAERDRFEGHGIAFNRYDLRPDSYHGFRVQLEVRNEAALRMIAQIVGEDYRMHHTEQGHHNDS